MKPEAINMRRHEPTATPGRYVSIGDAADRASVSKDTIRRMIAAGELHAHRFRGQIRIAVEDIDQAMRPVR
ncbi:helix-turn-helix domain-containing protein [Nocardia sp. NPDC046473]|uniref:helix-turn-helix domain-containing protein n=1 Tax=Nocardia sp. NPDC046473 TaxID=3155733 RepID=UPI0033E5DDEA